VQVTAPELDPPSFYKPAFIKQTEDHMDETTTATTFRMQTPEGIQVFVRKWAPTTSQPKAIVLIAHGAAEHSQRYERLARFLNTCGYASYAPDHRGHGMTAGSLDRAGQAGPDGWNGMVRDLKQLADLIQSENPGAPVFLLGHSMGSFLAQRYIQLWGESLKGAILSGSSGMIEGLEQLLPMVEAAAQGTAANQPSAIFGQMFAGFNQPFAPGRTGFEWLSCDETEVQKYVDDPRCGFPFSNQLTYDFLKGLAEIWQPDNEARIPTDLPILIFSGELDPVGGNTASVNELVRRYRQFGLRDLQVKFYPGARHETLNEINRDQVQQDMSDWIDKHLK
jgi:alpha-beta hydrolase superfamily lysophospholipase